MFSAEVESFHDDLVSKAENSFQAAHAIQNTVAHFIPRHDRNQSDLDTALGEGRGNCKTRWRMGAQLAERHSGFNILGHFSLWQDTRWSAGVDTHVALLLWSDVHDDLILVDPAPASIGGDTRFLARSATSTEHAHRERLKEQVRAVGRPIGSAAWKNSGLLVPTPESIALDTRLAFGESPVPPHSEEPSVVLSYADSLRIVSQEGAMRQLLSGTGFAA